MTAIQLPSEMEEEIIYHLLKSFWDEKEETASNLKAFRSQLSEFLKLGYDFCTILVFPALRRFQKLCKKAADLQLDESGRLVSADEESDPVITPTPKDLVGYINDREYLKIPMTYRRALYYFTVAEVYKHRIRCLVSRFSHLQPCSAR